MCVPGCLVDDDPVGFVRDETPLPLHTQMGDFLILLKLGNFHPEIRPLSLSLPPSPFSVISAEVFHPFVCHIILEEMLPFRVCVPPLPLLSRLS